MFIHRIGTVALLVLSLSFSAHALPTLANPILDIFEEACIEDKASDFYMLHQRLSMNTISAEDQYEALGFSVEPEKLGEYIRKLIEEIQEVQDLKNARDGSRSTMKRWMNWDSFSSSVQQWNAKVATNKEDAKKLGFNYDGVKARCHKGYDIKFWQKCMEEKIPDKLKEDPVAYVTVQEKLKRRIDIRDLQVHPIHKANGKLWEEAGLLKMQLAQQGYDWDTNKYDCAKEMERESKVAKERVTAELKAGITKKGEDGKDMCFEAPDKTCPPGTFVSSQRTRNHARGGVVLTAMYVFAKVILMPAGGAVGALGGPAGAAAGAIAGSTLGTWMAMGGGYLASLGPYECACFPRECDFDNTTKVCAMVTEDQTPTKNPYGKLLPISGAKCQIAYKSENKCVMTACGDSDFKGDHSTEGRMFGKIGRVGKDVFNCLSMNGGPSGALMFSNTLLDNVPNTVDERIALYTKLMGAQGESSASPSITRRLMEWYNKLMGAQSGSTTSASTRRVQIV